MLRQEIDEEDLRTEILSLRKHTARVCSENHVLKVKIRKLQDEMIRRDRQLDEFLHSKKFYGFSRNFHDKGASVLVNLKLKCDKLEQIIFDRDITIKRLHNTLQTAKLYNANSLNKKFVSKAVECNLTMDKHEYLKKGNNRKLDIHLPQPEKYCFDEKEESVDLNTEYSLNEKGINSIESQFMLDINFDLNQRSKPSQFSHARCELRHSQDQADSRDGNKFEHNIKISKTPRAKHHCEQAGDYEINSTNYIDDGRSINPAFQKIVRTIEELMTHSTTGVHIYTNTSADESVQFPLDVQCGSSQKLTLDIEVEENNALYVAQANTRLLISQEKSDFLENEEPPKMLDEVKSEDKAELENENLLKKIDKLKTVETETQSRPVSSEMPHEEIKQLHLYLMDMISQVDLLKNTISEMKAEQEKTEFDLKFKEKNIEKLAKEIEQLREVRSAPSSELEKFVGCSKTSFESAEKDADSVDKYKYMQKATEANIKKIAGKLKYIQENKSKSSVSVQSLEKKPSSRSSSKSVKSDRRRNSDKSLNKKCERKIQKATVSKKKFGMGNGDALEIPFFRRGGLIQKQCDADSILNNELDELD